MGRNIVHRGSHEIRRPPKSSRVLNEIWDYSGLIIALAVIGASLQSATETQAACRPAGVAWLRGPDRARSAASRSDRLVARQASRLRDLVRCHRGRLCVQQADSVGSRANRQLAAICCVIALVYRRQAAGNQPGHVFTHGLTQATSSPRSSLSQRRRLILYMCPGMRQISQSIIPRRAMPGRVGARHYHLTLRRHRQASWNPITRSNWTAANMVVITLFYSTTFSPAGLPARGRATAIRRHHLPGAA